MSTVRVNKNFEEALRGKVLPFAENGFAVEFKTDELPAEEGQDKLYLGQIMANNGVSQGQAAFLYKAETPLKETWLLAKEFPSALAAVAQFGDEITIVNEGASVTISCGTASVSVPTIENLVAISMPENDGILPFKADTASFVSALKQGSSSAVVIKGDQPFAQVVCFMPLVKTEGNLEKTFLRLFSITGYGVTSAEIAVETPNVDAWKAAAENKKVFSMNALNAVKLLSVLNVETVNVFLHDKQIIVGGNTELYLFVNAAAAISPQMISMTEIVADTSTEVEVKQVQKAISAVAFVNLDKQVLNVEKTDKSSELRFAYAKNKVEVSSSSEGRFRINLNVEYLKKFFAPFDGKINIGTANKDSMFVINGAEGKHSILLGIHK